MAGRPESKIEDHWEEVDMVLYLISTTERGTQSIIKSEVKGFSTRVFYKWLDENEELRKMYARAKNEQADLMAEQIIQIADESHGDIITDKDGNEKLNQEFVQRSRLRVDARKWIAAKLSPRRYGERQEQVHKFGDDEPDQVFQISGQIIKF